MENEDTSFLPTQPAPLADPPGGGSYVRNPDGSLTLVHRTKPSSRAQQPGTDNQAEE